MDYPEQFTGLAETCCTGLPRAVARVIVSTHPRTLKRIEAEGVSLPPQVELNEALWVLVINVQLQRNARAVLSDSGTITEELSILNFPALNIRQTHERPRAWRRPPSCWWDCPGNGWPMGWLSWQPSRVVEQRVLRIVEDYNIPNVSEKVVRIILSYTDYVNRCGLGRNIRPTCCSLCDVLSWTPTYGIRPSRRCSCRNWRRACKLEVHQVAVLTGFPNYPSGEASPRL